MPSDLPSTTLLNTLDEALEMLRSHVGADAQLQPSSEPLPSLLEQCEAACAAAPAPQPLRSIHHFACTGGTVMSKALFALPNTVVLSEIDPLSTIMVSSEGKVPFAPTDLIFGLRHSVRPVEDRVIIDSFLAGLEVAKTGLEKSGRHLVLRDHAHSQFCLQSVDPAARPTLLEMVSTRFDLRAVVTMRHPLDSFLSLTKNGWVHFSPSTLEAYAHRYLAFLDRHEGLPVILYEDFAVDPNAALRRMCGHLDLPFSPLAADLIGAIRLSGDSGRKEGPIGPRPRRNVPAEIEAQRHDSPSYIALCNRFAYSP
ncbi:MAG: hypothetical protein HLUCCA12_14745 [Rhodobacteraceae bacterium HLUCCA12]|nr:MAG: hypothetical protein HLUCCA12_14745 [Rhodobacteraceae bacterium HLUCCA12]